MRRLLAVLVVGLSLAACAPIDGGYGDGGYGNDGWGNDGWDSGGGWGGNDGFGGGGLFEDEDRDVVLERAKRTCVRRAEERLGDVRRVGRLERTGRYRVDVPLRVRRNGNEDDVVCRYDDGDVEFVGIDRPKPRPPGDRPGDRPPDRPGDRPPAVDQERRAEQSCVRAARGQGLRIHSVRARRVGDLWNVVMETRDSDRGSRIDCRFDPRSGRTQLDMRDGGRGGAVLGDREQVLARAVRACRADARNDGYRQLQTLNARSEGDTSFAVWIAGVRDGKQRKLHCEYDSRSGRTSLR